MIETDQTASTSFIIMSNEEIDVMTFALLGEWGKVVEFYKEHPMVTNDEIPVTYHGDTILHVCAQSGSSAIMRELIGLLPHSVVRAKNTEDNTVLHEVAMVGLLDMAELIVGLDEGLVLSRNLKGETPLYWAATYGHIEMFLFLSDAAGKSRLAVRRNDSSTVLHAAIIGIFYALALEILTQYPWLAWSEDGDGITPLHLLAQSPSSFKSRTIYSFHYVGAFAYLSPGSVWTYACLPVEKYKTRTAASCNQKITRNLMQKCKDSYISGIKRVSLGLPLLRIVYNAKQTHTYAMQLTRELMKRESFNYVNNDQTNVMKRAIKTIERPVFLATKMGIIEILKEVVKNFPQTLQLLEKESGKNVLHLAAEHQHVYVMRWLKSMKRDFANMVVGLDKEGNTVLHVAAKLREEKPWHIRGPTYRMQWECVQFERVKMLLPPHMITIKNSNNQTAAEVFTETHKALVEKGEKWLKDFSNNCLLVSTLITTMMFGTAFTFPGGNNENTGFPVLIRNNDFRTFLEYDASALLFSVFSLGIFLSISTSRYNEEDFFLWLPLKTILALTALFNSVVYTVVAFCQAFILTTGWKLPFGIVAIDVFGTIVGALCSVYIYLDTTLSTITYLVDAVIILIQS